MEVILHECQHFSCRDLGRPQTSQDKNKSANILVQEVKVKVENQQTDAWTQ